MFLMVRLHRAGIVLCVASIASVIVWYTPLPDRTTLPDCSRPCHELDWPMICRFKLHVEYYEHFRLCANQTRCSSGEMCNPHERCQQLQDVYLINRKLLGPTIQVCRNDILVIDIINHIPGRSLSFHWHGQLVRETPSMDGVPMVTQCPVLSHTVYQYKLRAEQAGTHYYHALTGDKILDRSLQGGLIVRESGRQEVHSHLYDEDFVNHTVHFTQRGDELLVNGNRFQTEFIVSSNMRYRFRLIHGGVCPLSISIASHTVILIAVDGSSVSPKLTDAVELVTGERLDFIVTANKPLGSYDFLVKPSRAKDCPTRLEGRVQLVYNTSEIAQSKIKPKVIEELSMEDKVSLVSTVQSSSKANVITLDRLRSAEAEDNDADRKPDVVLTLEYYSHDFNNVSFKFPSSPLLSQLDQVDPLTFCRSSDTDEFDESVRCTQKRLCHCIHVIRIPLKAMVQLSLLDKGNLKDNAFHLHGHRFHVFKRWHLHETTNRLGTTRDLTNIVDDDRNDLAATQGQQRISKDMIAVGRGQAAMIRFQASNPGFWSLHSQHNLQHQVLFQVGEASDFISTPQNFPSCGSYVGPDFFLI